MWITRTVKRVRWGTVRIYEYDNGDEYDAETVPASKDVVTYRELWGAVDDEDIWGPSQSAGIWGPVDEV